MPRALATHNVTQGRFVTALFYLHDDFEGGETNVPIVDSGAEPVRNVHRVRQEYDHCQVAKGVTITPRMGRVALFYNLLPHSMAADYHTWHGSCDVAQGEKWAAKWVSLRNSNKRLSFEGRADR